MSGLNKITDCCGNAYDIIKMSPSGFCGFHALSYCLTGTQLNYSNIIEDCLRVFTNIPDLFRLRTNFGGSSDSSSTLNAYTEFMKNAIQRVQSGFSIDSDAWCEDGHFSAISLLYDIAIYTYSLQYNQWYVLMNPLRVDFFCCLAHLDILMCFMVAIPHELFLLALKYMAQLDSSLIHLTRRGWLSNVSTVLNLFTHFLSNLQAQVFLIVHSQ